MPDIELILPSDPIADCINPPETVVIGSIMENVPVVIDYGANLNYVHNQNISSSTWTATHNLGRKITGCRVVDTGGNEWVGLVTDIDNNNCTIDVGPYPFAGIAYLI